jgi:ABC-type dipeptide/oligopeptide/nickel transport system permease component
MSAAFMNRSLWTFIARRALTALVQLFGVAVAVFFLIRLMPADPVARLVGLNATPEAYAQSEKALGLDQPLLTQFTNFLGLGETPGLLQGDLGTSWVTSEKIMHEIARFLPVTLELVTVALLLSVIIAIPLGLASAKNPKSVAARGSFVWGLFAGAQPDYWWGLLFVFVFFFILAWAPAPIGRLDPLMEPPPTITGAVLIDSLLSARFDAFASALGHLALPIVTMVFTLSGAIVKMVRQNTVRALESDYVLYARASGLPEKTVAGYALRAALIPSITLIGIFYGVLLSAAVTVEAVFSLGGIGEYAIRAVLSFDYPAIQGTVLAVAAVSLLIYLLLDLIHAILDPRAQH